MHSIKSEKINSIYEYIEKEKNRQEDHIELIASENFVSEAVLDVTGSVLTNKYAEGYPSKRYYGGCEFVDEIENIARESLKEIFGAEHANVQPHSGSNANLAVYLSCLKPGDTVLGMELSQGGHLTHGSAANISGKYFNFVSYGCDEESEQIDYDKILELARQHKPKLIVAGASAYSRSIDFSQFRKIADDVNALLMVDMAHISGLVAAGEHQNPVEFADFVTSTTHKTMRGPRGAFILCKEKWAKKIDSAVFPGLQGGPLMHVIAGKAVSFQEALDPSFKEYQHQVRLNASAMANQFLKRGVRIISGGTDNHMFVCDLTALNVTGQEAEDMLGEANITCNKNSIPNDPLGVKKTSGIRLGTPAMTTRGLKEEQFIEIADLIVDLLTGKVTTESAREKAISICREFPLY